MIKLNWNAQPSEQLEPTKFGNTITYIGVNIADTPIGKFWIGAEMLINKLGQAINQPYFLVLLESNVISPNLQSGKEAMDFAEKWYTDRATAIHAQVEAWQSQKITAELEDIGDKEQS